jgi:hypothetical protein
LGFSMGYCVVRLSMCRFIEAVGTNGRGGVLI